jgi:hypothetical protein
MPHNACSASGDVVRARARLGLLTMCTILTGCGQPVSPTVTTGLSGVVMRGPIVPVCQINVPCEAPFSGAFSVEQDARHVTEFRSDADGRFTVMLRPGTYRIVPAADAPIISPQAQSKMVDVGPVGLTQVLLEFDTGLR